MDLCREDTEPQSDATEIMQSTNTSVANNEEIEDQTPPQSPENMKRLRVRPRTCSPSYYPDSIECIKADIAFIKDQINQIERDHYELDLHLLDPHSSLFTATTLVKE